MLELRSYAIMEERTGRIIDFLEAIADEFMAWTDQLFDVTLRSSGGGLSASGITDDVTSILTKVNTILTGVQSLQTVLSSVAGTVTSISFDVGGITTALEDLPSEVAEEVVDAFLDQLAALSRSIDGVGQRIEARFHANVMQMQALVPAGQLRARGAVSDSLAAWLQTLSGFTFPNVQTFGLGMFDKLKLGYDSIGDGISDGLSSIEDGLGRFGVNLQTGLNQFGGQLKDGATGGLNILGNALMNMGVQLGNAMKDASIAITTELRRALVEAMAAVTAPAIGLLEQFYDTRIAPQIPEAKRTLLPAVVGISIGVLGSLAGLGVYAIRANQRINLKWMEITEMELF